MASFTRQMAERIMDATVKVERSSRPLSGRRRKWPKGGGGPRIKEGFLNGGLAGSTGGGQNPATQNMTVWKGTGANWAETSPPKILVVTNRDDSLGGGSGAFIVVIRVNGEWRPIWVACSPGNEVQRLTITGTPTGGFIRLRYDGLDTTDIAYNETAAGLEAILESLANIGSGNVSCTGGPLPGTPIEVEFTGELEERNVLLMTVINNSLTGGTTPQAAVVTLAQGCCN